MFPMNESVPSAPATTAEGLRAHALEERGRSELLARAGWFGHRLGQVEEVVQTGRERRARRALLPRSRQASLTRVRKARMLLSHRSSWWRLERDPRRARLPPQFRFNGTGGGKPVPQFPSSGKPNQEDVVLDPVKRDMMRRARRADHSARSSPGRHLAGPKYDNCRASPRGYHGERDIHSGRAPRSGVAAQPGLPPNAPACRKSAREHRVELSAARASVQGRLVRPAHLPQDLGLTHNLGVESGRDLKEVPHARLAVPSSNRCTRVHSPRAHKFVKPRLEVMATRPVDLESVAGGQDGGAATGATLLIQPCGSLGGGEGQLFPHLDRSRTVAHPYNVKGLQRRGCHSGLSVGEAGAGTTPPNPHADTQVPDG